MARTWIGDTISEAPEVFHVYEPFNDDAPHHLKLPGRFVNIAGRAGEQSLRDLDAVVSLGGLGSRIKLAARGFLEYRSASPALAQKASAAPCQILES